MPTKKTKQIKTREEALRLLVEHRAEVTRTEKWLRNDIMKDIKKKGREEKKAKAKKKTSKKKKPNKNKPSTIKIVHLSKKATPTQVMERTSFNGCGGNSRGGCG